MSFGYETEGAQELQQKLKRAKSNVKTGVMHKAMVAACMRVIQYAKSKRFRRGAYGQPAVPNILTSRSGSSGLMGSLHYKIGWRGKEIIGRIGSPLQYAAIHEYGGLAGRNHASRIPARPYLRPSIERQEKEIAKDFKRALWNAIKAAQLA